MNELIVLFIASALVFVVLFMYATVFVFYFKVICKSKKSISQILEEI